MGGVTIGGEVAGNATAGGAEFEGKRDIETVVGERIRRGIGRGGEGTGAVEGDLARRLQLARDEGGAGIALDDLAARDGAAELDAPDFERC